MLPLGEPITSRAAAFVSISEVEVIIALVLCAGLLVSLVVTCTDVPTSIRWTSFTTTSRDGTPNEYSFPVMEPFALPEGWEPFGGERLGAILARRCASR